MLSDGRVWNNTCKTLGGGGTPWTLLFLIAVIALSKNSDTLRSLQCLVITPGVMVIVVALTLATMAMLPVELMATTTMALLLQIVHTRLLALETLVEMVIAVQTLVGTIIATKTLVGMVMVVELHHLTTLGHLEAGIQPRSLPLTMLAPVVDTARDAIARTLTMTVITTTTKKQNDVSWRLRLAAWNDGDMTHAVEAQNR